MGFFEKFKINSRIKNNKKYIDNIHGDLKGILQIEERPPKDKKAYAPYIIYLNDEIEVPINMSFCEYSKFSENISYLSMTPKERYLYLHFLSDPYQQNKNGFKHGMMFVRCLYNELERHLFNGFFEEAYQIIINLRCKYQDKSFWESSSKAIVLSCLMHQKYSILKEFVEYIEEEDSFGDLSLPIDLLIMAKGVCNVDIHSNELVLRRLELGDIEADFPVGMNHDDRFMNEMEKVFGTTILDASVLLSDATLLPTYKTKPFSNPRLSNVEVEIPDFTKNSYFYEGCKTCFENIRKAYIEELNAAIAEAEEKEKKRLERKKAKPPKMMFDHKGVKINEAEEQFYIAFMEAIDGILDEDRIELHPGHLHLWFAHGIDTIGGIKLQGRKFKISIPGIDDSDDSDEFDRLTSGWVDVSGPEEAIKYIPYWIKYVKECKKRGWWLSLKCPDIRKEN